MRRLRGDHHPRVQLSASLGIDRKTVRKYLAPAIADGVEPGGEPLSAEQWAELIGGWFPELGDRSGAGLDVAAVRAAPGSDQGLAGR